MKTKIGHCEWCGTNDPIELTVVRGIKMCYHCKLDDLEGQHKNQQPKYRKV